MKNLFFAIFIAGVLFIGCTYANGCFRNFRCFHFSKNRNISFENSRINNRGQQRPRNAQRCPRNGRGQGKHQGDCRNPDKGPGYGQGEGRGQGRYRSN